MVSLSMVSVTYGQPQPKNSQQDVSEQFISFTVLFEQVIVSGVNRV
jgi:hypothetical protein